MESLGLSLKTFPDNGAEQRDKQAANLDPESSVLIPWERRLCGGKGKFTTSFFPSRKVTWSQQKVASHLARNCRFCTTLLLDTFHIVTGGEVKSFCYGRYSFPSPGGRPALVLLSLGRGHGLELERAHRLLMGLNQVFMSLSGKKIQMI